MWRRFDWGAKPTTLFYAALIGGSVLIVVLKQILPGLWGGIIVAVILGLILIGVVIRYKQDGQIDFHRAGDNIYYLGLLYTLVSLGYVLVALFLVDPNVASEQKIDELVGSFGIALSSTICGIIGRIVLHNSQKDDKDDSATKQAPPATGIGQEQVPSFSLDEARQLRRQLREARDAMSHFTRTTVAQAYHTREHTEQFVADFTETLKHHAQQGREQTQQALENVVNHWRTASQVISEHIEKIVLDSHTQTLEAIQNIQRNWAEVADQISAKTATTAEQFDVLNQRFEPLHVSLNALESSIQTINAQLSEFDRTLSSVQATDAQYVAVAANAANVSNLLAQNAEKIADQSSHNFDFGRNAEELLASHTQGIQTHLEETLNVYENTLKTISNSESKYLTVIEKATQVNELLTANASELNQQSHQNADQLTEIAVRMASIVSSMEEHHTTVSKLAQSIDAFNRGFDVATTHLNAFQDSVQAYTTVLQDRMRSEERITQHTEQLGDLLESFDGQTDGNNSVLRGAIQRFWKTRERN
ncbi:MAG: hypothetical protein OXC80_11515 [Gammaproteobacteria bacterium]|nr:hypothetical protein [Gammaproteobacteria bacterium]